MTMINESFVSPSEFLVDLIRVVERVCDQKGKLEMIDRKMG